MEEKQEKQSCEFQGKTYADKGVVCIGDQCIQCYDGHWGPNQYEVEERLRNRNAIAGE